MATGWEPEDEEERWLRFDYSIRAARSSIQRGPAGAVPEQDNGFPNITGAKPQEKALSKFVFDLPNTGGGKVEPGQYQLVFKDITPVPADLERDYREGLRFVFEIADSTRRQVGRTCSKSTGPKATLPGFLLGLTGAEVKGGQIDFAPFIGRRYLGTVVRTQNGGVRVESVMQLPA